MNTGTSIETTVASIAAKTSGGGSAATVFGWALSNEVLAFLGIVIAFLGFVVNVIFKLREDRRQQEMHQLNKAAVQAAAQR